MNACQTWHGHSHTVVVFRRSGKKGNNIAPLHRPTGPESPTAPLAIISSRIFRAAFHWTINMTNAYRKGRDVESTSTATSDHVPPYPVPVSYLDTPLTESQPWKPEDKAGGGYPASSSQATHMSSCLATSEASARTALARSLYCRYRGRNRADGGPISSY